MIACRVSSSVVTGCSICAGSACSTSCMRAARSRPSRTRCATRPRRSPSSSPCSSARRACRCSSGPGRGVRLTDAAVVLARHAGTLLEQADRAAAELAAAAAGDPVAAACASPRSSPRRCAWPRPRCARSPATRPALRCGARRGGAGAGAARARARRPRPGARRRVAAPAARAHRRARAPRPAPRPGAASLLPAVAPAARAPAGAVRSPRSPGEAWVTGHRGHGLGGAGPAHAAASSAGYDPDIRHRANDSVLALGLVRGGGSRSRSSRGSSPARPAGRRGARDRRARRAPHDLRRHARGRRAPPVRARGARGDRRGGRGARLVGQPPGRPADHEPVGDRRAHVEHGAALARGGDEPGVAQRGEVLRDPARAAAEAAGELRGRGGRLERGEQLRAGAPEHGGERVRAPPSPRSQSRATPRAG